MIFDSERVQSLCHEFKNQPEARQPLIVRLATWDEVSGEREYIENLVALAPKDTRAGWIAGLTHLKDEEHLPDWFEVMLFGWLRQLGEVAPEPEVNGSRPDFELTIGRTTMYIEAKTVLRQAADRESDCRLEELIATLDHIQAPYIVEVTESEFGANLDLSDLSAQITDWLESGSEGPYFYHDYGGNRIHFEAEPNPDSKSVATIVPASSMFVRADELKPKLKRKAGQHKTLRRADHPYVLALYPEKWVFSGEEVVRAWFGDTRLTYDSRSKRLVDTRLDRSGLHFLGREIKHTSVSGTLLFQARWSERLKRRKLHGWYVQNPFARSPIPPDLFPVEKRYVVVTRDDQSLGMVWQAGGSSQSQTLAEAAVG